MRGCINMNAKKHCIYFPLKHWRWQYSTKIDNKSETLAHSECIDTAFSKKSNRTKANAFLFLFGERQSVPDLLLLYTRSWDIFSLSKSHFAPEDFTNSNADSWRCVFPSAFRGSFTRVLFAATWKLWNCRAILGSACLCVQPCMSSDYLLYLLHVPSWRGAHLHTGVGRSS